MIFQFNVSFFITTLHLSKRSHYTYYSSEVVGRDYYFAHYWHVCAWCWYCGGLTVEVWLHSLVVYSASARAQRGCEESA